MVREGGKNTNIPFKSVLLAIENYQINSGVYEEGPGRTRHYGLKIINSPVWSLLHLLEKRDYKN